MSKKGDPEDQETFPFIERLPVPGPRRRTKLKADLASVAADDRDDPKTKRAQRRARGKSREKCASLLAIQNSSKPEQAPQHHKGKWVGILTVWMLLVGIFVAPQQVWDALETYGKWLGRAADTKETNGERPSLENQSAKPPIETGSIDHHDKPALPESLGALREKSISAVVDLVGEGSYADQLKKFQGFIKNHSIEAAGWKAVVMESGGVKENLACVLLRDPQSRAAQIRVCSTGLVTAFRPKDCVRITGAVVDYPADQILVVQGALVPEKLGCHQVMKRSAPTKSSETWLDRLFKPQVSSDPKP